MAINPNIKKKADDIRNKIYGKEVRESLASGLEAMSSDVVENEGRQSVVESRQDDVESQWQNVVDETTNLDVVSAPEIIAARDGESNLKARLDKEHQKTTTQLDKTARELSERGVNVGNFPRLEGETDDSPRIKRAYESAVNGDTMFFPAGDYYMKTGLTVVKNIFLEGVGLGTRILVEDFGFELGDGSQGLNTSMSTMSSVKKMLFTSPEGGERGHVARLYGGILDPIHALETRTTPHSGYKKNSSENATNVGVIIGQAYAPCVIEQCHFNNIGTGIKVGYLYGHNINNNKIEWCNVGVHVAGNTTTVSIRDNTIERCAIGIISEYPSHHVTIIENVIEANYGGCDILLFNQPEQLHVKRNYFEASLRNIMVMGDGGINTRNSPHKLYFEENFSMSMEIKSNVQGLRLINNNLDYINFDLKPSQSMRNIYLFNNYEHSSREPFDFNNITYNSVAENFMNEVTVDETNDFIGAISLEKRKDLSKHIAKEYNFSVNALGTESHAFFVEVPNEDSVALIEVESVKYLHGDFAPRKVTHEVMLKRRKGESVKVQINVGDETLFEEVGSVGIQQGSETTMSIINGDITGKQTVDLRLTNRHGSPELNADWLINAKVIRNRTDIKLIP